MVSLEQRAHDLAVAWVHGQLLTGISIEPNDESAYIEATASEYSKMYRMFLAALKDQQM